MSTKWFIVGCFGILFVFAVGIIGGAILWQIPEVRNLFSGTKQQAQQNPNPLPSRPAPLRPASLQQEPLHPAQYNSSNNSQPRPQDTQQNPAHNQKQNRNQNQTKDVLEDDYTDQEEFDNTGPAGKNDNKIYDGFDDFNKKAAAPSVPQNRSIKTVEAHGIQTVVKSFGGCTGLAPNSWTVSGAENHVAIGIDFLDTQLLEGATYMVANVPVAVDAYGRDFYGNSTPARYIQGMLTTLGVSGFQYTSQGMAVPGGFVLVFWQGYTKGQPVRGFAHYMTFQSATGYIIALRYGFTPTNQWPKRMILVYDVAASARCQKRLFPVPNYGSSGGSVVSKEPQGSSKDLSTLREETTMEFQNVYSPTTGQHWEASYDDYNPTGPEGPGYYRQVGNSYEKLAEGFPP